MYLKGESIVIWESHSALVDHNRIEMNDGLKKSMNALIEKKRPYISL